MNWALEQRGLSSGQKLILLVLADCYSPFGECSPPQEYLAFVTDLSHSGLNVGLTELEGRGLLSRSPRRSGDGKNLPTTYVLHFEDDLVESSIGTSQPSHYLPAPLRSEVFARDENACVYCGEILVGSDRHVDHIIPRSRGGSDEVSNLATACKACNSSKGDRPVIEFLKARGLSS